MKAFFNNHYKPLVSLFIVVGLVILSHTLQKTPTHITSQSQKVVFDASDTMTSAEYGHIKSTLQQTVQEHDPAHSLKQLQDLTNIDPKINEYCHGLAHEIGHFAYEKYGFAPALGYQDDTCGSGYVHGVIEAYFTGTKDITSKLHTVCTVSEFESLSGKCFHGIGHGLMFYTGNNIPLSLYYCSSFTDLSQRSLCSEGVFMENFNSDVRFHKSAYLHPNDPFYPCQTQSLFYKDACYFYATDYYLHLHPGDYTGAMAWCDTAEAGFVAKCVMGVGSRTMKYNLGAPTLVEKVCMSTKNSTKTAACVDGMMSYFLVQYNSVKRANKICTTLQLENQSTCLQAVANRKNNFLN